MRYQVLPRLWLPGHHGFVPDLPEDQEGPMFYGYLPVEVLEQLIGDRIFKGPLYVVDFPFPFGDRTRRT